MLYALLSYDRTTMLQKELTRSGLLGMSFFPVFVCRCFNWKKRRNFDECVQIQLRSITGTFEWKWCISSSIKPKCNNLLLICIPCFVQKTYKTWKSNKQSVISFWFNWQNYASPLFKITCTYKHNYDLFIQHCLFIKFHHYHHHFLSLLKTSLSGSTYYFCSNRYNTYPFQKISFLVR